LRASRWTILIVGIVAFVGAIPDVDLILQIVSYAVAILGSTFFFPLIVGLISKSVSKEAAIASSVGGALVCCIWTWARLAGAAWAQELHPGVIGLAVSAALMFAVARMTTPLEGDAVTKFFPEKA
jgi:Na+/proline symporter